MASNLNSDTYNHNLSTIFSNNSTQNPAIKQIANAANLNVPLKNGENLISQNATGVNLVSVITDDITLVERTKVQGYNYNSSTAPFIDNSDLPSTSQESLNNRLEITNKEINFKKNAGEVLLQGNDNNGVPINPDNINNSFQANEITPSSIKIKSKDGNELVCIDTNDNTNGTIEIRDNDNSLIFKISKNGMILNVPTNIGANSFISSNNFKFTSSRADKFKVVNRHYVDQRHRIDFESLYWKTVSTQLHSLYQNESYPAKIKEYIKSNNVPIRYEYEVLEDSKLEYSKDENGNQIATTIKYERPIVKKYTGSSYIIGTNLNWRFEFTRARRKTQRKGIETEFVFDNMGNYTYQKDAEQNLITDKICI